MFPDKEVADVVVEDGVGFPYSEAEGEQGRESFLMVRTVCAYPALTVTWFFMGKLSSARAVTGDVDRKKY